MKTLAAFGPQFSALPVILIAGALLFSGCTTMRPVPPGEFDQLTSLVHGGDTVTCETHLGRVRTFKVTAMESGWLVGKSERVYFADARRVEVRRFSPAKTVVFVVALGAGGAALVNSIQTGPWLGRGFFTVGP